MKNGLETFVAAISGDIDSSIEIFKNYSDALAAQLGSMLAVNSNERTRVESTLQVVDGLPGGMIAALTWPPVTAYLLGRGGEIPEFMSDINAEITEGANHVLATEPGVASDLTWLHGQPRGEPDTRCDRATVSRGWQLLEKLAPDIAFSAKLFTRMVYLQVSDGPSGSWSSDEFIGCTVLINVRNRADDTWLVESLWHEAVHHCQGMVEIGRPFIHDSSLVRRPVRYRSPWTGVELTAKSLLAACFVWFALTKLWSSADQCNTTMWHQAAAGFVDGDPAAMVASFADALDPEVVDIVAQLQHDVRAQHRRVFNRVVEKRTGVPLVS